MYSSRAPTSVLVVVLLVVVVTACCSADDVTDGTNLVLALLVHRHGDRTPVKDTIAFSTDPDEVELRTRRYGYGQLTDEGRRTGYLVGEYVRRRYGALLSPQYNRTELHVRCTDSTRTKMTALTSLAALYPPGPHPADRWSETLAWEPVPYTTLPAKYDSNLSILNCPKFMSFYNEAFTSAPEEMSEFNELFERWSELIGFNMTRLPVLAYAVYDVYKSQVGLGVELPGELAALLDEAERAAAAAMRYVFGDEEYIGVQAGVLLDEFLRVSALAMAGEETQRVRILSAHDYNVFSLMSVARLQPDTVPEYGAVVSLELRRVSATGEYVVLPVYLRSPRDQTEQYLQVSGCAELLCGFQEFAELTSRYRMQEPERRAACGFTDDLVVDDSSIA